MKVELSDEAKLQAQHEVYAYFDGEPVRRLLLEKTRCHIYYIILERENLVRVVAVWGAART